MKILSLGKTIALSSLLAIMPLQSAKSFQLIKTETEKDLFIRTVTPQGTDNKNVLKNAPSSLVNIQGKNKNAKFVIDLSINILYKYDNDGNAQNAYLIASGKPSMKTEKGVRIVSHVEKFPYRGAPRRSKRRRHPRAYGPFTIVLNKIDTKTGEESSTGQFIHGTNVPTSIGKYASHGCMRMDNEIITELSKEVKRGDIILIK